MPRLKTWKAINSPRPMGFTLLKKKGQKNLTGIVIYFKKVIPWKEN